MEVVFGEVHWRKGYRAAIEAEVAHEELEKIRRKNDGKLTADVVVERAASKRNRLHKAFTWNDGEAGHKWRLHEARNMINALVVVREESPARPTRSYVVHYEPKKSEDKPVRKVYSTMEEALGDPDTRAEILQRALNKLVAIRREFAQLQELAVVFRAVDEVLETIEA